MKKLVLAALLAFGAASGAQAALTIVAQPGAGVDLSNIHVGDTFSIDFFLNGSAGESLESASGGNFVFNTALGDFDFAVGPDIFADLSTSPLFATATFTALLEADTSVALDFSNGIVSTNVADYTPTSNTLEFRVLAAVPEPATWAMFIGGFGLVGASLRRKRVAVSFG